MQERSDRLRNYFWIGDEKFPLREQAESSLDDSGERQDSTEPPHYIAPLEDIRIRVGTLLKTETVSLLLGAGASVNCGGQLIGSMPLALERVLIGEGIAGTTRLQVRQWLKVFYLAVRHVGMGISLPETREDILQRQSELNKEDAKPLKVNFEQVLATLYNWQSVLLKKGKRLRVDGIPKVDIKSADLTISLNHVTRALANACDLPTTGKESGLKAYRTLVHKLLTRPLNLRRANIFTLNYDTLVEQAADAAGVVLLDGFTGAQCRVFRPESYEQDLYFPAETTEGRVHRFDHVLHLHKLHGSITWTTSEPSIDNPYGVRSAAFDPQGSRPLLIYPTPGKYGEALGLPYSELFRRFANSLTRPQSVLFVIGYGFGDQHVNAVIRQALAIPSFTLVVVDPAPNSEFVTELREQGDRRVWIVEGKEFGTFEGFVGKILPDLHDEDIRKKVLETYNAIMRNDFPRRNHNDI